MTALEITLIVILYIIMMIIVGKKQYQAIEFKFNNPGELTLFLAIIWPITLFWYIIRAVFFEEWY